MIYIDYFAGVINQGNDQNSKLIKIIFKKK